MKLIDLDKAIESMAKLEQEDNEAYGVSIPECFDSNRAIKVLNNIPTVQAVPIDVLDKIRAEIDSYCSDNRDRNDGLYIAMKIIDKYRESEGV